MLRLGRKKRVYECKHPACFRMCRLVYFDNSEAKPKCPFPPLNADWEGANETRRI